MVKIIAKEGEQIYSAAFKRRGCGVLLWFYGSFPNRVIAKEKLREQTKGTTYKLYGGPFLENNFGGLNTLP